MERVPIWFMRQAGRSLPEYHQARGDTKLLEAVSRPELAAELTLQPVRRYGVDAAILFSDIVVPIWAVGFGVDVVAGVGPTVERPLRSRADLRRLRELNPEADTPFVGETVRALTSELDVPLIGFAGAPFTLASYLVEGRPSARHNLTKSLMISEEALWFDLLDVLAGIISASLAQQAAAGAAALQIFDSWGGALSPQHYRRYAAPATARVMESAKRLGVPVIFYGLGMNHSLEEIAKLGADVVGLDWRTPLDEARLRLGPSVAVQGNLDPAVCLTSWENTEREARDTLRRNGGRAGFIFNLGHGVLPDTNPSILERLVEFVHSAEGLS